MNKVLVTGATGFIGPHLVALLIEKGYEVHCLVRYTSDISALRGLNVSIHVGDVREPLTLKEPVAGARYIFHLAGKLLVTTKREFDETNVEGSRNVLQAAALYSKNSLEKIVMVSSLAAAGPNKEPVPYTETAELHPISWYGSSKKELEAVAHSFYDRLPITIVRPAIVYGENEKDLSQIYPLVEYRIQPKLGIFEKSEVAIYVKDLVRGFVGAAESQRTAGQTYFLNHPEMISSKQIVKKIGAAMGKSNGLVIGIPNLVIRAAAPFGELIYYFNSRRPKMTVDKAREVTQRYWLADPSKALRDFGWSAEYNMVEGMRKTLMPYFEEKKTLRAMALDDRGILWFLYFITGLALGCLVEATSHLGGFYVFHPSWLVLLVILVPFGLIFPSLAKALRRSASWIQFFIGAIGAGSIELINQLGLFPGYYWVFKQGWPLGITNPWMHVAVLSIPGGIFILLLNSIMRAVYKNRLTIRGDEK